MRLSIGELAKYGLIADLRDHALPPNAWTNGRNVLFSDDKVKRALGWQRIYEPPSVPPYWCLHTFDAARASVLIYAGLTSIYAYMGGAHVDISRTVGGAYTAGADDIPNGGVLGGIPIYNNGIDLPQFWAPVTSGANFENLTNWDANHRAKVLRPFKNFLVAMDITESGSRYTNKVRISHPAAPGALPSSWDETDPTKDARTFELTDWNSGAILDGVPLGDNFILYKESSAHAMSFIGGNPKWKVAPLFEQIGLLSANCCVPYDEGRKHFLFSGSDLITHNGQSIDKVGTKRQRKWLHANISSIHYAKSFSFNNMLEQECWFCFPLEGANTCTIAAVYNWVDGQLTFRDIPDLRMLTPGLVQENLDADWNSDSNSWDSDMTTWDTFRKKAFLRDPIGVSPSNDAISQMAATNQNDGVNFRAYIERTGLDVIGVDRYGHYQRDKTQKRLINRVWPQASGAPFFVEVGAQERVDGPVSWGPSKLFTPGVDQFVDVEQNAQLWAIRFSSVSDGYWELDSYDVEIEALGQH
jgi:hypothetical protein